MLTKEQLKLHIESFPDEISIDDLINRLIFIDKLENRIEQSEKREVISEDQLSNEMEKWFE